jgi:simple sugar transport system permease protein
MGFWTSNLIDGRGWIAIALVIFAQWRPIRALLGSLLFGFIYGMQFQVQMVDVSKALPLAELFGPIYEVVFNPIMLSTYPYLVTIIILTIANAYSRLAIGVPSALMEPYMREVD